MQIPTEEKSPLPPSPSLPNQSASTQTAYWHIPGSPMSFENIGFSRPSPMTLPPTGPGVEGAKGKVKFLICAECDLGPVGWSFEGGDEAWLAVERVRYGLWASEKGE